MVEEVLIKALDSSKSTIIFGNLGRNPSLLEFYLRQHIIPKEKTFFQDQPKWFERNGKNLFIWCEPEFGAYIPNQLKYLVFTSHLDLKWDSIDVISLHVGPENALKWVPYLKKPYTIMRNIREPIPFSKNILLHLDTSNKHKMYLQILQFDSIVPSDKTWTCFSVQRLRKHLLRSFENYQKHIGIPNLAAKYLLPPPEF